MSRAALEAVGLTRRFGGLTAVSDVSLSLSVGELHAVIGPNGAGKSTLVNLLSGELRPSAGAVRLGGADATGWPRWRLAQGGIGRSFQRTNVLREMTVLENVAPRRAGARLRAPPAGCAARRRTGADRPARGRRSRASASRRRRTAVAGTLSHGQLRLLEIAMALATAPARAAAGRAAGRAWGRRRASASPRC